MALRLQALYAEVQLPLSDQPTVLGRSRTCMITATNVSRLACTCFQDGDGSAKVVAAKKVFIKRKGAADALVVDRDDTQQIQLEDILYLAATEDSTLQYGFKLLGTEKAAASKDDDKVDHPNGKGLSATDCPQAQPSKGCFVGKHIVFWTRSHTAKLKQKLVQAGAELEDTISEKTHLVVAARDTSAVDAAANLAAVPKAIPRLSKKWEGRKLKIPTNVDFVVPQYISDCLVQSRILPTNIYLIALQQVATKDTRTYSNEEVPANSCEAQDVYQVQPEAQPQQSQGGNMQQQVAEHHQETSVTPVAEHQEGSASASAPAPPATQQHPSVSAEPAVGSEATRLGIYPNIKSQGRSFTGGATGIPWGTGGQWEEPWDQQSALDTIRKIERHWYQLKSETNTSDPPVDAAEQMEGDSSDNEEPPRKQLKPSVNKVCLHMACSAQPVCLVEQLQTVRSHYRGRVDQFRIKAVERAITELTRLQKPLVKESEVAELSMGARSKEKVLEIILTGTLRRNEMMADDEELQIMQLFLKVWGAAEATCLRWYAAGCRTLNDVRARNDLTEQQVAGLKYFDDMQQRIPRTEVEQVHSLVSEVVKEVLAVDGLPDADRLHCRVTGSYIRGKPMTGDMDFLIMPPPSKDSVACGAFLQALLARLLRQGLLLDEMNPSRPRPRDMGSATWLGLCKPAGSLYVRRIDFKVYPARYAAFAVNYFIGSGPFIRALRYWALTASSLAQQKEPSANGFKLSDTVLVPLIRQPRQRLESGQVRSVDVLVPPGIDCDDETQIFETLGLHYVPPYMRYFGTNYQ